MIEVFRHADSALVALRQSVLENAGIPTFVRNGATQQALIRGIMVAIFPIPIFYPTLCVLNDEDYPEAMRLLRNGPSERAADWTCPQCGETVPGNFDTCWKCQAERAASLEP